jgi:hypothetical protein
MAVSPSGSTRLTLLPTSYLANLPPDYEVTLESLVQAQDRLADEAREAMPYAFDECSYEKGYLRQSVWSCIGGLQAGRGSFMACCRRSYNAADDQTVARSECATDAPYHATQVSDAACAESHNS